MDERYDPSKVEAKWRRLWRERRTNNTNLENAERPYYTDAFTTKHNAGPSGDESTQWNAEQVAQAKRIQIANYGKPGYIFRSVIPGGLNETAGTIGQTLGRAANVTSMLLPGGGVGEAAGIIGFGLKALRGARAGRCAGGGDRPGGRAGVV